MSFNYGYEKRKFDREWERLESEYLAAGMDPIAIAAMKAYDWNWFRSQRVYENRIQRLPSEPYQEDERSKLFQKFEQFSDVSAEERAEQERKGWITYVENERLYRRLSKLSAEDVELLTLILFDGYRQSDVAKLWGCSRNVIYKRLQKIKKILRGG